MNNRTLLNTGVAGTVLAVLCYATPVLVILFGVPGLSAWVGRLNYALIPALAVSIGITIYALQRRDDAAACCTVAVRPGRIDGAMK